MLNAAETVKDWVERVRRQIEPFLSFEGDNAATMVNNLDWTENLSTIDFLRDIGKHFPVNRMLARDVVRTRLEAGISYTEFSYVLLQSMDFLNLFREHGVTLQFGGSDQWGNLTGGVELIRRADGGHAHAFATPLITKADGTKYGKTEGGALWLDPEMMSPYAFYQFWLNQGEPRSASCCGSSRSSPARRSRRSRPSTPRSRSCGAAQRTLAAAGDRRWCTAPRRPGGSRRRPPRCSAVARSPTPTPTSSCRRSATARPLVTDAGRARRLTDLFVESGLVAEPGRGPPRGRRGRRLPQQRAGRRPRLRPDRRRLPRRQGAGAAARQEELRGRRSA